MKNYTEWDNTTLMDGGYMTEIHRLERNKFLCDVIRDTVIMAIVIIAVFLGGLAVRAFADSETDYINYVNMPYSEYMAYITNDIVERVESTENMPVWIVDSNSLIQGDYLLDNRHGRYVLIEHAEVVKCGNVGIVTDTGDCVSLNNIANISCVEDGATFDIYYTYSNAVGNDIIARDVYLQMAED